MTTPDTEYLAWSPHWTVTIVPGEAVYLLSEATTRTITDAGVIAVADAIDGTRTMDDLADLMDERAEVPLATAYLLLEELLERGHIRLVEPATLPVSTRVWALERGIPEAELDRLLVMRTQVLSVGATGEQADDLVAVARAAGLPWARAEAADPDCDLAVVVADDYCNPVVGALAEEFRAAGTPLLLCRSGYAWVWVGPLLRPGVTACWECLRVRIEGNRDVERYLQTRVAHRPVRAIGSGPAWARALLSARVIQAVQAETAAPVVDDADTTITTIEIDTLELGSHAVVRRPQCGVCGTGGLGDDEHPPIEVEAEAVGEDNDSGYRMTDPEETLARYRRHLSPISGAVSMLVPLETPNDDSMHVYAAGHNFAMLAHDLTFLRAGLRNKSSGKGFTDSQARASAFCEALERYQGLHTGEERRRHGSMADFDGAAIHPNDVMLWSDQQYADRDSWNARELRFALVPEVFPEDQRCDWSPVWSISEQRTRWLPTGLLYYAAPRPDGHMYFIACSNGAAAGNTLTEAVLQGSLELVERDAVAVWWYNRSRRPPVDMSGFSDPRIDRVLATYERLGRPIRLIDLTHDFGIPVVGAISARLTGGPQNILMGFGAHLEPQIAALRAISEVTQFYPAVAPNDVDGRPYDYDDAESQDWWRGATLETHAYLVPDPSAAPAPAVQVRGTPDIGDAVRQVQARFEDRGLEMLVLDQTRPDVGLPTVKVIAPGIRHFWARYAPGRLYDVPVELGWRETALAESDLNPTVMFL